MFQIVSQRGVHGLIHLRLHCLFCLAFELPSFSPCSQANIVSSLLLLLCGLFDSIPTSCRSTISSYAPCSSAFPPPCIPLLFFPSAFLAHPAFISPPSLLFAISGLTFFFFGSGPFSPFSPAPLFFPSSFSSAFFVWCFYFPPPSHFPGLYASASRAFSPLPTSFRLFSLMCYSPCPPFRHLPSPVHPHVLPRPLPLHPLLSPFSPPRGSPYPVVEGMPELHPPASLVQPSISSPMAVLPLLLAVCSALLVGSPGWHATPAHPAYSSPVLRTKYTDAQPPSPSPPSFFFLRFFSLSSRRGSPTRFSSHPCHFFIFSGVLPPGRYALVHSLPTSWPLPVVNRPLFACRLLFW